MEVELFHGPVTTTEAILYAQVAIPSQAGVWQLRGELRGPINQRAGTLPVALPFMDAGPGETVLAKVRVPDPCSWSMDLPSLYDVNLELLCDGSATDQWQGVTGFRDFGAAGRSFSLNGERWVVRGAALAKDKPIDTAKWHDDRLACVCEAPTTAELQSASETGTYLIVRLPAAGWQQELRRVSIWPAVWAAVLPRLPEQPLDLAVRANVVLGAYVAKADLPKLAAAGIQGIEFLCVRSDDVAKCATELPVVAVAASDAHATRAACDQLQTRLAPANLAGYVTGWK